MGSDGPTYDSDEVEIEDLVLPVDAFPDGWERNDELNENFDASFANEDETIIVLTAVEIYDEVSGAEESFEDSESGFRDPQEMDFADEAFWDTQNDEVAYTIFRDSNLVGQAAAIKQSGTDVVPDQQHSQKYAEAMYEHWQDL